MATFRDLLAAAKPDGYGSPWAMQERVPTGAPS